MKKKKLKIKIGLAAIALSGESAKERIAFCSSSYRYRCYRGKIEAGDYNELITLPFAAAARRGSHIFSFYRALGRRKRRKKFSFFSLVF